MPERAEPEHKPVEIGRFETLGAWLGVWTPPKGATVPPVPKRKLAAGTAIVALALAALAVWLVPRIQHAKRSTAGAERRAETALTARERRRLALDQRLHQARGVEPARLGGARPTELARRQALVHELEQSITRDAHQRAAAGTLRGPVLRTSCRPYSREPTAPSSQPSLTATSGKYECLTVTGTIPRGGRSIGGALGYPFWARVNFSAYSYVWCRINLRPGERGIGGETAVVSLPAPCNLQRG